MKHLHLVSLVLVLGMLAPAAAGASQLPDPSDPEIVVPTTLGGITTGMSAVKADRAWGDHGSCNKRSCLYVSNDVADGFGQFEIEDGEVKSAVITAGFDMDGETVFEGPLLAFQTDEGIELGTRNFRIKEAYPGARKTKRGYRVSEGPRSMTFGTGDYGGPRNRVTSISISRTSKGPK